jgi:hypothetical protein
MPMFLVIMSRVFGMFLPGGNPKLVARTVSCVTRPTRHGEPAFLQRLEILDQVVLFLRGEFRSVIMTRIGIACCRRVKQVYAAIGITHFVFVEYPGATPESFRALRRLRQQLSKLEQVTPAINTARRIE